MKILLISVIASVIGASAHKPDEVTVKDSRNVLITGATEGYVVSPGFANGTSYPENFYGSVTIESTKRRRYVKLYFEDVDLDAMNYCSGDRVEIWETLIVTSRRMLSFCGSHRPRPWVSRGGRSVKVVFKTDGMLAGRGFRIRYNVTADNDLCDEDQFQCNNRQCIRLTGICNGVIDCADGSDEKSCRAGANGALKNILDVPCGTPVHPPNKHTEDRLVGGTEAVPHSWPWQVSLGEAEFEGIGHFCGGSLISSQWVLTAAHCLNERTANDIVAILGAHSLLDIGDVITRKADTLLAHSNYSAFNKNYDIALVKLDVPVNFTDKVRPICLPEKGNDLLRNGECFATGWGQTRGSGSFATLKQAPMSEFPFQECRNAGGLVFRELNEHDTFCAGDPHGEHGVCHGDSGGPLFCAKDGTGWSVQGVANAILKSTDLGTLCGVGSDSFWNRVSAHLPWIQHAIRVL